LWLQLLPVLGVNTGDSAVGVIQQNPVANDLQNHKTATRHVVVYAPYDWLLIGLLFHNHIDVLFSLFWSLPGIVWMMNVSGILPGSQEKISDGGTLIERVRKDRHILTR
jgi:hypothetical protein